MRIAWNTNAAYTDRGQRIAAARADESRIVFLDLDRQILGTIDASEYELSRAGVMRAYTFGDYRHWNPFSSDDGPDRELYEELRRAAAEA